jgi:hypothetical protein
MSLLSRTIALPPGRRLGIVIALAWLVYSVAASIAVDRWQHRAGHRLSEAGFGYGALVDAIDHTGAYRVCDVHYPGVCFSAHRLPLIPALLMGIRAVVGDDLSRVGLAKALVGNALLALAIWIVLAGRASVTLGAMLLLALPFLLPFWNLTLLEISVEEGYLIPALALLFSLLWFSKGLVAARWTPVLGVALIAAVLAGLKHSMPYWALAIPLIVAVRARSWRAGAAVLCVVVAALAGLATFNSHVANRFTIESSWEGWNLYKGNNPETSQLYPWRSLDLLDYTGSTRADRALRDEWDYDEYFRAKAVHYIRSHPAQFVRNCLAKAWVLFGEVRRTGASSASPDHEALHFVQSAMMVLFRAALWAAMFLAFTAARRGRPPCERVVAISYLLFLLLYGGFHVVGFAYERHVMPLVVPTVFFLFWIQRKTEPSPANAA